MKSRYFFKTILFFILFLYFFSSAMVNIMTKETNFEIKVIYNTLISLVLLYILSINLFKLLEK